MRRGCAVQCPTVASMSRLPFVVILGATGTGKSRLAIELAQKFSGEVISADSMQVYKYLDISMAKVTNEERRLVQHHMMDFVEPGHDFTVHQFRRMVLPIVDDLAARNTLPLVVGGTIYYIESLLWDILVDNPQASESLEDKLEHHHSKFDYEVLDNETLYTRLCELDPERGSELHPNDRRKIIRSLELSEIYGVKHSELLKQQRQTSGSSRSGNLRPLNFVLFHLNCEKSILMERLNKRVDSMVSEGLVQELVDFHREHCAPRIQRGESIDYTRSIFQNIGLKEFCKYLALNEEEKTSEMGEAIKREALENVKLRTRQYAKRQASWVRNRLVKCTDREVPPIYELDCTNVDEWEEKVLGPASNILSAVLRGEKPEQIPINEEYQKCRQATSDSAHKCYTCEICGLTCVGETQWNKHLNGRRHRNRKAKIAKLNKENQVVDLQNTS